MGRLLTNLARITSKSDRSARRRKSRLMWQESLESRLLFSVDPVANNDQYNTYADGTLVVGASHSLLANDVDSSQLPLSASLVEQAQHGVVTLQADGTFMYAPEAGFTGEDSFTYRESDGQGTSDVATASITVQPRAAALQNNVAAAGIGYASQLGGEGIVSPNATGPSEDGAMVTVNDAETKVGGDLTFTVILSGVPSWEAGRDQIIGVWTTANTAGSTEYDDIVGANYYLDGDGSFTVTVHTHYWAPHYDDDGNEMTSLTMYLTADRWQAAPGAGVTATGTIDVTGAKPPSPCDCGCPGFKPDVNQDDGTLDANGGPSNAGDYGGESPARMRLDQGDTPHPIISADDVLSSSVSSATDIKVTYTLGTLSSTVYYDPSGYTSGDSVRFAQQFDAASLATGQYTWDITVTEEYSGADPIIRSYGGATEVRNLDSSPYGRGWGLRNLDRLYITAAGANLDDGSGNLYYFASAGGESSTYITPPELWGQLSLTDNHDGTYTLRSKTGELWLFDSSGYLTSDTDPLGNVTSYAYSGGLVASVTDPNNRTTTFTYTSGQLTSTTDFAGRVTSYTYDTSGRLASISEPDPGHGESTPTTTFTYNSDGRIATYTDATGTTTYTYDRWGAVTKITHPDSTYELYDAPAEQGLVDTSGGVGSSGNPAALIYTADIVGSHTDEDGHVTTYIVDQYGNVISSTDGAGNTTSYTYDAHGRLSTMTQPPLTTGGANLVTTYTYDSNGNLIREDLPDGTHETWTYDSTFNEVTSFVDPAGRETDYSIDSLTGEVLSMTQVGSSSNLVTSYTYTPAPTSSGDPPAGLVASITDPRGIVTNISYNANGLPTQVVSAYGTADQASVSFTYDTNGNPATYTDELGRVTTFTYDDLNRLIETDLPAPDPGSPTVFPVISALYGATGKKTSETDPLGNVTTYSYGAFGNLIQIQQPDPAGGTNYTVTQYGHDDAGNLTTVTDPLGRVTTYGYDADNRQTSARAPNPANGSGIGGPLQSVTYDALDNISSSTDANGNETDYTYDAMGRVLTVTGPAPSVGASRPVTTYTYNADGQVLTETDPLGHVTSYAYDDFGRLIQETLPDPDGAGPLTASVLHWGYDADSNLTSQTDALGHVTTYAYDYRNRKLTETDALSGVTHYAYDDAGNLLTLEDPDGNTTTYVYDDLNRVISETNELGYARSFVYDLNGNLIQETDRDGRVRDFTYDHLSRETAEIWMDGSTVVRTISYSYNADGELTSASDSDSAYAYTYDGDGNVTSVDNYGTPNVPNVVLSSQYDSNGNRTQVAATIGGVADFLNTYAYDGLNRLTQLVQQGQTGGNAVATKGANLSYNLLGQLTSIFRTDFFGVGPQADIATSAFSYDTANRLTGIAYTTDGGTAIDAFSWTYDAANRVASMTTTAEGTATYSYDNTDQVTGASYTGTGQPANESYSYDANGNRTNAGYSTGTNNQLLSDGTFNYAYDHEGNRTSRTRLSSAAADDYLTTYTWDYRNRLTDVYFYNNSSVLTKHVHYTYDVFDHLISKSVDSTGSGSYDRAEYYAYDRNDMALDFVDPDGAGLDSVALATRYLDGPGNAGATDQVFAQEDAATGGVLWLLADNLGTTRDVVDDSGAVVSHFAYNSFGELSSGPTNVTRFLYTGQAWDADVGLQYNWHRWYDPTIGRWISEAPEGFAAGDANLSRYAGNITTSFAEPSGHMGGGGWTSFGTSIGVSSNQPGSPPPKAPPFLPPPPYLPPPFPDPPILPPTIPPELRPPQFNPPPVISPRPEPPPKSSEPAEIPDPEPIIDATTPGPAGGIDAERNKGIIRPGLGVEPSTKDSKTDITPKILIVPTAEPIWWWGKRRGRPCPRWLGGNGQSSNE